MSSNHTFFTKLALLLIVAGALALAGCGGDDGVDQSMHDMVVAERDAAQMAAAEAEEKARMEAEAKAEAEEKARMEAEAKAMAEAEARMAEEARIKAEAAAEAAAQAEMEAEEEARMAEEERMKAAEAQREAEEKARMAEEARMKAEEDAAAAMKAAEEAETQAEMDEAARMMAEADRARLEAANMAAEMAARGSRLHPAMHRINAGEDNSVPTDMDYLDKAAAPPATTQPKDDVMPGMIYTAADAPRAVNGLGVTHSEAAGTTVRAVSSIGLPLTGYTASADDMAPEIEDWDGLVLSRRDARNAASQILYAYTDVATVGAETFYQKYGAQLSNNMLTVDRENLALAGSPSFPAAHEGVQTFTVPADGAGVARFSGTFDGVPGTFACTGDAAATCTVTPNVVTGILALSGTGMLTFSPTDGNTVISRVQSDYLYFGYWLHKPDDPSGAHQFGLVSGGSDPFDVRNDTAATPTSNVHALSGRASYSGPAAGKYVTRDLTAGTAKIGQFTATAALSADFNAPASWAMKTGETASGEDSLVVGTDTTMETVNGAGVVGGVITDFMEGDEPLYNWHVTLNSADLAAIGQREYGPDADEATTRVPMLGSGMTASGESTTQFTGGVTARVGAAANIGGRWVGSFYGNDRADGKPEAIAGAFEVHAPHVAISGAFGAYNPAE